MSREAQRRSTTLFVFADAGTRWDVGGWGEWGGGDKGGDGGVSSILQYASKTKSESLCPSTKYETSKSYELFFFFLSNTQTHSRTTPPPKKNKKHTQKKQKTQEQRGKGETSQGLSADERLIVYCLPCCLTPLTALRSLELTRSLLTHTHTHAHTLSRIHTT